jgi:hypothetical protein
MRRTIVSAAIALAALAAGAAAIAAETVAASEAEQHPPHRHWHFDGPFGTYDRAAAQRGYQIYAEVCSACHSLQLLAYRNLMELGLTENQVKGLIRASRCSTSADDGQPIERPALVAGPLQEAALTRCRRRRQQRRRRPIQRHRQGARAGRTTSTES